VREAENLTTFMCRMSWEFWESKHPGTLLGHTGPVTELLYLFTVGDYIKIK